VIQPDGPATFSRLGDVEPFGLLTPTQYLPRVQPQLESADYAQDFEEVKQKGRATGSTRGETETRTAQLFAQAPGSPYVSATTAFALWHNVARDLTQNKGYSLTQTARTYALLSTSMHDSLQTSQTSKFIYRLWRPETAIKEAAVDNNPATTADTEWVPLLTTPSYPSHASNMACVGFGSARALANVFGGDAQSFIAAWYTAGTATTPPTVVHAEAYTALSDLARDEGNSHIWGGIHFRFEIDASEIACAQVADYIYDNYLQPRRR